MSSILDSLKKLEKETAQQEQLLPHAGVGGKAAVSKYIIIIGIICLFAGAIGLTVLYQGFSSKSSEAPAKRTVLATKFAASQDDQEKQSTPPQNTPAPLPGKPIDRDPQHAAGTPEVISSESISATKPLPDESNDPEQDVIPGLEQPAVASKKLPEEEQKETPLQEPEPQTVAAQEDTSDSLADVSPEEPAKTGEPMQIDRLGGVGFKIQAISWSEIPEQSLAVINSQVLREGDDIEGYQITRINPDDIILQRGGKNYRLDFRSTGQP